MRLLLTSEKILFIDIVKLFKYFYYCGYDTNKNKISRRDSDAELNDP